MALSKITDLSILDDTIVNADINNVSAAKVTAGTLATARLGTGTASSSTVLYGDQTYKTEPGGGKILQIVYVQDVDASYVGTNSASYVSTAVAVTITPASTSNKIQINLWTGRPYNSGTGHSLAVNIYSSATSTYLGTGDNVALVRSNGAVIYAPFNVLLTDTTFNTTSAVTYTAYIKSSNSWSYLAHEDSTWQIQATEISA